MGSTLGAAEWNLNVLQQGNWTQEVLAGTNADKIPGSALASPLTVPGTLNIAGDTAYSLQINTGDPYIIFDTNDWLQYLRASNGLRVVIGSTEALKVASDGKLTGTGFFASGETAVGSGATVLIAHGWGSVAGPRFVDGVYATGTGVRPDVPLDHHAATLASRGTVRLAKYEDNSGSISVINDTGATVYVTVYAIH